MISNLEEMPQALNYLISKVESLEEMVNELSVQKDVHEQPEWMNIDDLRQYLPSHPAKQTIYGWVNDKVIPYYKNSKKLTFKKSEIMTGCTKGTERVPRNCSVKLVSSSIARR